jgi:hypothetical protein
MTLITARDTALSQTGQRDCAFPLPHGRGDVLSWIPHVLPP